MSYRRRLEFRTIGFAGLVTVLACGSPPPGTATFPTEDRVVATASAVGVPYDRVVLLREGDHLLALELAARSSRGDHIGYRCWLAAADADGPGIQWAAAGEGETSERDFTGTVDLPGLRLSWSRGSAALGWLYWPEEDRGLAVYSRPWLDLATVDPRGGGGKWLKQSDFTR